MDPFNLPKTYMDVHGKRKKESRGKESTRPHKKNKVVILLDEDEVPLNERQKAMLLKDTSGGVQHSSNASDTASGKLHEASTQITFDSVIFERILPIQPTRTS